MGKNGFTKIVVRLFRDIKNLIELINQHRALNI